MKFSKQLRFAALSVVCMSALASCIKDPVGGGLPDADLASTKLAISLPGIQNGMKTRAEVSQFDGITDVNIFITSGNNILHRLYITDFNTAGSEDDGGITYGPDTDEVVDYIVTYKASWLEAQDGVHRRGADNYIIVANYRYEITEGVADDVTALRELPIGRGGGGEVDTNQPVMYGESGVEVTLNADGTSGNKRVEMRRTAAMITLEINGSGLNSGVTITPVSVSLHNVPIGTYIGKENNVTNSDPTNSRKAGWVADDGDSHDLTGTVSSTNNVGKHYPMSNGEYDYTDSEVKPLFMYENWHGENFGNTTATQINKRPANCASTAENAIESYSQACSYLEVKARFVDGSVHGEIVYRVFLGSDAISNFDVLRNHYYKVTLNLSGTGRQEGDASWRLDVDTSSIIISDSDFIINGGGEMIVIDVLDGETPSALKVKDEQGNDISPNWVYMYSTKSDGWIQLQGDSEFPLSDNDQVFLYVSPMIRGLTWNGAGHVRRVTFYMQSAGGNPPTSTPPMTITQYEPVGIPLSAYAGNPEIAAKINELGYSTTGTLYIDRVDAEHLLPWGFDGTAIDGDYITSSGFNNGNNLMDYYQGAADDYLPQGFVRDETSGADGSAMMHAAFMRYYQRYNVAGLQTMYPQGQLPSIDAIQNYPPTNNLPYNFAIPSVKEWELLDMINQDDEIEFTEGQNIPAFIPYWTSTAVEGTDKAKTFNMTGILPSEVNEIDRTEPQRYRMIHYRP